jgi:hypothetical protein
MITVLKKTRILMIFVAFLISCTKNPKEYGSSSAKGLVDVRAGTHVFATKFENVDLPDTIEKEDAAFLCFYKAPFVNGVNDYSKVELLGNGHHPVIYQRYLSAIRKEILGMRIAGAAAATVGAVGGGLLSLTLWREQPVAMAFTAEIAKWAGGIFLARTGLNKATGNQNDPADVRNELLAATPFLLTSLAPILALPVAALVNTLSKEKALNELASEGVFKETIVDPDEDLGNSPYVHLRLTASAYEAMILKIMEDPLNTLPHYDCTSAVVSK